jgi:hypothetical protein
VPVPFTTAPKARTPVIALRVFGVIVAPEADKLIIGGSIGRWGWE